MKPTQGRTLVFIAGREIEMRGDAEVPEIGAKVDDGFIANGEAAAACP